MRCIFRNVALSLTAILINASFVLSEITIHNSIDDSITSKTPQGYTKFNTGPSVGNILNAHYFPGVLAYTRGDYGATLAELDYCLNRPEYIKVNPRGSQYLSAGHYMRGMIYLYHASGDGRHTKAKDDFEKSIQWDQSNYYAYLELARVHAALGSPAQAVAILQQLLASKPPADLIRQASEQLGTLKTEKGNTKGDKRKTSGSQSPN